MGGKACPRNLPRRPKVLRPIFHFRPLATTTSPYHCALIATMPPTNLHCTSRSIISGLLQTTTRTTTNKLPPAFLLPAFQTTSFSTTPSCAARKDHNPRRGISAIKRSGLNKRTRLSVSLSDLPKPVLDPDQHTPVKVADDHGLWGFFNAARDPLLTPEDLHAHGRGWSVQELRLKGWDDLHRLWWVCVKEVNRINTYEEERKRLEAGYGQYEAEVRLSEVSLPPKLVGLTCLGCLA